MDILGKSPISLPGLLTGKLAFFGCLMFFIVKIANIDTMLYDGIVTQALGLLFIAGGLTVIIVSVVQLGKSAAVGIPERDTMLITRGLYQVTRNPIYLGGFIMCVGSCLFAPHVVNFLLFGIASAVHVRIVKREEEFLESRFGQTWLEYKERVPRYIGRISPTRSRRTFA